MTVYMLSRHPVFPDPERADPDGLLAVGGDLRQERLLAAYEKGIFPWYDDNNPILWWTPSPRLIIEPDRIRISSSLRRLLNGKRFEVTFDRDFDFVIEACAASPRSYGGGTWLTREMLKAYKSLHKSGYAHSVEVRREGEIVGGLYGVSLGRAFFGESMFYRTSGASKIALVRLCAFLSANGFTLLDCQQTTEHMLRFGAFEVSRQEFNRRLQKALELSTMRGRWTVSAESSEFSGQP